MAGVRDPVVGVIQPAGGGGVSSIVSSDGSLEVTGTTDLDLSIRALGGAPANTLIISDESDFPAPIGGVITVVGRSLLTGLVVISDDVEINGPDGGDAVLEGAAGVEGCGLVGNISGAFLTGSITLQKLTVENTHASGEDMAIGDTTSRIIHIRLVTSKGTSSGRITAHAGGMEVFNFVQDGAQSGLVCAAAYGAIRFIGGFFNPATTPANFVSVTFTDTSSVAGFLIISGNTFTTTAATQFGFGFGAGMTIAMASIVMTGNTTTGPGATLDDSVGSIQSDDQRIVSSANLDIPDWLGKVTAEFFDQGTPISFVPNGSLAVFEVVPSENVGPTTVMAELAGARNFRFVQNSIQDYYLEYIGDRDGVTADMMWVLTHTKSGVQRLTAVKLTVDRAPVTGTFLDVDGLEVSRRDFQVRSSINPTSGVVATEVSFGDRFTLEISSVSNDAQEYSTIQLTAETR